MKKNFRRISLVVVFVTLVCFGANAQTWSLNSNGTISPNSFKELSLLSNYQSIRFAGDNFSVPGQNSKIYGISNYILPNSNPTNLNVGSVLAIENIGTALTFFQSYTNYSVTERAKVVLTNGEFVIKDDNRLRFGNTQKQYIYTNNNNDNLILGANTADKFVVGANGIGYGNGSANPLTQFQLTDDNSIGTNKLSYKYNVGVFPPQQNLSWAIGYMGFNAARISSTNWKFDLEKTGGASGGALISTDIFGRMRFITVGSSGTNQTLTDNDILNRTAMMIDAYGNIQIGSPSYQGTNQNNYLSASKLAVNGQIACKAILVKNPDNQGSFPDYVFEPDYKLKSLSEVEKYIQENKHLPEVPSQKEVEENGLNIYEMNTILLKKVEELTLHMIQMQKEMEALKKVANRF